MLRPSGANRGLRAGRSSAAVSPRGVPRVGDPATVGAPRRRVVAAGVVGEAPDRAALCRVVAGHQPEVVVVRPVHAVPVAHERDQPAVWRPLGVVVVEVLGRDLPAGLCRDVEHEQVGAAMIEIAPPVTLELEAVDHPGRRRLGRAAVPRRVAGLLGRGVLDHQRQACAVGRPGEAVHPLLHVGERLGLAAQPVEQPDLGLAAAPRREEREVLAVGAPPRARRRRALGGHREGVAAIQWSHPDPALGLVVLQARRAHDVRHPAAVGADLRIRDPLDREEIVHGDEPAGWRLGAGGDGQQREQDGDGDARRSVQHGDSG
jgi:hypothetical protein